MIEKIDLCGIPCPEPVIHIRKVLAGGDITDLELIIDNSSTSDNVSRYLEGKNFTVGVTRQQSLFILSASRPIPSFFTSVIERVSSFAGAFFGSKTSCAMPTEKENNTKIFILISADTLGVGDDALGAKLMVSYIKTLGELGDSLWQLVFVNGGVRLATTGSLVLDVLQEYERQGVQILVCGTCLEHFKLAEEKQVGQTTNMLDIVTGMDVADKVISL